jgi:hypothetical protein
MSEDFTAPETGADETAVVDQVETPVVEAEAAETPPAEEPEKKPDRVAKRFSELSGQRDAARQEADYWRQQALARPAQAEPEADPAQIGENPFSPDAIQAAVERALTEERRKDADRQAQTAAADKAKSLQAKLYESGLEGAVLIASGADIPFSQAMIDALAVSEQPAQIAHHLGTNPAEAARIAGLPPQLQGYELAKLEGRLASQPKTTGAPPPPSTVGTRGAPSTGLRDDMPIEDWVKTFRAQPRR